MTTAIALSAQAAPNHPDVERAYADAPSTVVAEILHGNLLMRPRPARRHTRLVRKLGAVLFKSFDASGDAEGDWLFLDEPELHLGARPDKMQPDMSAWRGERLASDDVGAAITAAPDWVCEVLSPSTEAHDRGVKAPLYAEHRVSHLWLIDPAAQGLEAFTLERGVYRPRGAWQGEVLARVEPFEAIELDLGRVWRWR